MSIRKRFTLAIVLLLCGVGTASVAAVYIAARGAFISAGRARLKDAAVQLSEALERSAAQFRSQAQQLAQHSAFAAGLSRRDSLSIQLVRAVFDSLARTSPTLVGAELRDSSGTVVFGYGIQLPGLTLGQEAEEAPAALDELILTRFLVRGDTLVFASSAPVMSGSRRAGSVVQYRRVTGSPESSRLLSHLVGSGVRLMLGNRDGTVWSDLTKPVAGPPVNPALQPESLARYRRDGPGWYVAVSAPVHGTPWQVVLESPMQLLLGGASTIAYRVGAVILVLVGLGTFIGWTLSGQMTKPLAELSRAAEAIASGEYSRQVNPSGPGEVQSLARGFARMAASIRSTMDELAGSLERYRRLFESSPAPLWLCDAEDMRIADVNHAAVELYGYSKEEFLGLNLGSITDAADVRDPQDRSGDQQSAIWRQRTKDGRLLEVELTFHSVEVDGKTRLLVVGHDLTARRRAEAQLIELNAELERRVAERTAELEEANRELEAFSYSVSHDLRAPLRALDGFSQALLEDYGDRIDERGRTYLSRIRAASQRMGGLIDDLLMLSRVVRAELRLERVDLSAMAAAVAEELRKSDPGRAIIFSIAPGLWAEGDRRLLRLVLENLFSNAWKFTGKTERAQVEFGVEERDGMRMFFVRDNGAGFDMRYAHKLFTPFQRLHSPEEFEGTGIGLATVYRIIRRHGGTVGAEGKVGGGATIWFTLPPRDIVAEGAMQ